MRAILLFVTVSSMTYCDRASAKNEIKDHFFSGHDDPNDLSIEHANLKQENLAESTNFSRNLTGSQSENIFKRDIGRTPFHSDILSKPDGQSSENVEIDARRKRLVFYYNPFRNMTWLNGVSYMFNTSDHNIQKAFKMGVKVWSDITCINFKEDKNARDKVVVVAEGGSWSKSGRFGGDQFLSLVHNATEGSAVHEIGHVLGHFHTMQRYDRDSYITVVEKNVHPDEINQFLKLSSNYTDVYGLRYDYGSVMHYHELSFSVNNQPTMIAKDPYYQKTMGSELISFSDAFVINEHYGCNAKCNKTTSAKCVNEGYPHPRNCSICICPSGYGGDLCDRRPPGCGEDLVATNKKKNFAYSLGFGTGLRDHFDFCHYMITAPDKKKIEIEVRSISHGFDSPGCPRGGVEVKAQKDQKMTGYRFCATNGSGGPIVTRSNRLPIILYNRFSWMQATFTYRYVD